MSQTWDERMHQENEDPSAGALEGKSYRKASKPLDPSSEAGLRGLPEKWRDSMTHPATQHEAYMHCADELDAALAKEARDAGVQEGLEVFLQPLFQYRVAEQWWNEEAPDRPYAYLSEETQQLYLGRVRKVLGLSVLAARDAAKETK